MNKIRMMIVMLALVAILPGAANATHWEETSSNVDCGGWDVEFFMTWIANPEPCADISYVVELVGDGIDFSQSFSDTVCEAADGTSFTFGETWEYYGLTLNGTYTATITFTVKPDYGGFWDVDIVGGSAQTFTCEIVTDPCHFTPGYWKNHADMWPVMELDLGGTTYSQAELLEIMDTPVRGDATIILAYHTIAAKLNVAKGADPALISDALVAADAVFAAYGIGDGINRSARSTALDAKNTLANYNEMGCDEVMGDANKAGVPTDEAATWGNLKSMYR
jgi:hypothetical protein